MTVEARNGVIRLSGRCPAEDAEPLLTLLASGMVRVDLTGCECLHGAVLQLLMAAQPAIVGEPAPFLRDWIIPAIAEPPPNVEKS